MIPAAALPLLQSKVIWGVALVGGALLVGFMSGLKLAGWRHDSLMLAAERAAIEAYRAGNERSMVVAGEITKMLSEARLSARESRDNWRRELRDAKTALGECRSEVGPGGEDGLRGIEGTGSPAGVYLSATGVGLWNNALESGLPRGFYPERVDAGAGASSSAVRLGRAMINLEENAAICNDLRVKLRGWQELARKQGWQVR